MLQVLRIRFYGQTTHLRKPFNQLVYSQPFSLAIRAASIRFDAPSLLITSDR